MKLPAKIKELRESRDLSREQLAKRLRRNRLWMWRIETGNTDLPAHSVPRLCKALGVSVTELFDGVS